MQNTSVICNFYSSNPWAWNFKCQGFKYVSMKYVLEYEYIFLNLIRGKFN